MKLHALFSDHMVLQCDSPIIVWGTGQKGEKVQVELNGKFESASVDNLGHWQARLSAFSAGGPYSLKVFSSSGEARVIQDVMIGEVWIASGQSNMEWRLSQVGNPQQQNGGFVDPLLRFFNVQRRIEKEPQTEVNGSWKMISDETAPECSAVAFYYGQELRKKLGVPIGIINSSVGGTPAESWVPYEGLESDPELRHLLDLLGPNKQYVQADKPLVGDPVLIEKWLNQFNFKDPGIPSFAKKWADRDLNESWHEMEIPCFWNDGGQDLNGVLWFRRVIELPASWAGKKLILNLGAIDKSDITFFNEVKIGSLTIEENGNAWCTPRRYEVPADLVKEGPNVIAVRNFSHIYHGGLTGPKDRMRLELSKDEFIALHGKWFYKVERNFGQFRTMSPNFRPPQSLPTVLYNGMIAPLQSYAIRGVIWYQGESNAARAKEYEKLFKKLVREWRKKWSLGNFPFYFVQLANYNLGNGHWPILRESQRRALELPNMGMAVAIDIGDSLNIHPKNKKDVGLRLALLALHHTYHFDVVPSGPLLKSAKKINDCVSVEFDYADGLNSKEPKLMGFSLSDDGKVFEDVEAVISKSSVKLQFKARGLTNPKLVRYGWADDPNCNLYNGADLPAAPFETSIE